MVFEPECVPTAAGPSSTAAGPRAAGDSASEAFNAFSSRRASAAGYGWPKEPRLLKRAQFLALSDRRAKPDLVARTGSFLVLGRRNGLSFSRLGLTVTKKVGRAVVRSRLKRQVREFFRLQRSGWPTAMDILFIARIGAGAYPAARLLADLAKVGAKLAAWPEGPPGRSEGSEGSEGSGGAWSRLLAVPALGAISLYQRFLSPLLPPACRFYPTCSHYAAEAIARHGLGRGGLLALWRLFKCHPFNPGGYDPVPERAGRAVPLGHEAPPENRPIWPGAS